MDEMVTIRSATGGDAAIVHRIYTRSIHALTGAHYTKAQREAWAPMDAPVPDSLARRLDESSAWILEQQGIAVAIATLTPDRCVDLFFVTPEVSGQGVAGRLMRHVLDQAGPGRLTADVSKTAKRFFEKHGFCVIEQQSVQVRDSVLENYRMQKI